MSEKEIVSLQNLRRKESRRSISMKLDRPHRGRYNKPLQNFAKSRHHVKIKANRIHERGSEPMHMMRGFKTVQSSWTRKPRNHIVTPLFWETISNTDNLHLLGQRMITVLGGIWMVRPPLETSLDSVRPSLG